MNISINARTHSIGSKLERTLIHLGSSIDVIPFITMKYLSQKQEESKDNLEEFQNKYGFTFRDYELISNIIKKFDKKDESYILDLKSALNALQHSRNDIIRDIFSRISEETLNNDSAKGIITVLNVDVEFKELYEMVHYKQLTLEAHILINIPPLYELLGQLANINHTPQNVYDPSCRDGQTVTNLETFEQATLYEMDEDEYYHLIQNMIINGISLDKLSLNHKEILVDDSKTKYDTIISIPYQKRGRHNIVSADDDIGKYDKYKSKQVNSIHLLNLIDHLDDDGVLITTTTQDLLVRSDALELRKCLIEKNLLDTVIEYETGFRTRDITILIIRKNKKSDDYLFFKPRQFLPGLIMPDILEKICEGYEKREAIPKLGSIITKDEIIDNEYNLNPKRYVYTLDYEEKSIKDVLNRQKEYAAQIKELDEEIEEILKKITDE